MEITAWIQLGVLTVAVASGAWAVVKTLGDRVDKRFDKVEENVDEKFEKVDFQFQKVDLKFEEKFGLVTQQIDRLKDTGNDRHIANIERLARLEGQISALPQKVNPSTNGPPPMKSN